ncbi:unnamed protein product [Bursaphelenchus okinawaensis]|uniref:Uncharacterized protein n=1 Tax=Bursaphelenchus okinawaensis TaxID=465554 RepID=A0A811L1C9_9BILA|nr:unnamed protein product [Bursaphelenchus okinawaensis]CAG9114974.1 unnamed protein product [Bursaphelenchus okinawaensis]
MNDIIRYSYNIGKDNEKFLQKHDLNVTYQYRNSDGQTPYEQLRASLQEIESFDDKGVVSVLSPKLFNILPEGSLDPESKRWLSPNMLSFQDEGMIPIPKLFKWSQSDDCETQRWIDLLLDLTGASNLLNGHVKKFDRHMKVVKDKLHPRIQQLQKIEEEMADIRSLITDHQQEQMARYGYADMTPEQLELAYGEHGVHPMNVNLEEEFKEQDFYLEKAIRMLAELTPDELMEMAQNEKFKQEDSIVDHGEYTKDYKQSGSGKKNSKLNNERQKNASTEEHIRVKRRPPIFDMRLLDPFAFDPRINTPNFLGSYILSPYAFYLTLFAPYVLGMDMVSPRALVANIFSPQALILRVLSPTALQIALLNPSLLTAWIIVPEALMAKILAPKALDGRVLAPETLSITVLSPAAGVLRAWSPNVMNAMVLAPSFFTYGMFSGNRYIFQVLSPGFFGMENHPILMPERS